jgi:adenylosuccinate lyase
MIERYKDQNIEIIFSDKSKYETYATIERLNDLEHSEKLIRQTHEFLIEYSNVKLEESDLKTIKDIELETKHETLAFLKWYNQKYNNPNTHKELTSSDLIDTSDMIRMKAAFQHVLDKLITLSINFYDILQFINRDVKIMSRTHGQHALPISLRSLMEQWYALIQSSIDSFRRSIDELFFIKIAGPVGQQTQSNKNLENALSSIYSIETNPRLKETTQIIPRYNYSRIMFELVLLGGCLEKIATDIRLHSQTGIEELLEPFENKQKGSSAMPNKRNPIICENICGLSRLLRSYMHASLENIVSWNHRDISHSSVERVIIPDSFHIICNMLDKMSFVIDKLQINYSKIEENLNDKTSNAIELYNFLKESGADHETAYEISKKLSMMFKDENKFFERAKEYGFTKRS